MISIIVLSIYISCGECYVYNGVRLVDSLYLNNKLLVTSKNWSFMTKYECVMWDFYAWPRWYGVSFMTAEVFVNNICDMEKSFSARFYDINLLLCLTNYLYISYCTQLLCFVKWLLFWLFISYKLLGQLVIQWTER